MSALGELVRRADPDRYFCGLFAPAARRETLWTLYAFNHELARAREAAREPMAALIRLQWWREVVEGARRRHEVAGPVGEALDAGFLDPAALGAMVDAREAETEAIETMAAFETYLFAGAGGLMVEAARVLGMAEAEALRPWGAAYGLAGVLRSAKMVTRQGRSVLPTELPPEDAGRAALVAKGQSWLHTQVRVPSDARAAALPAVLARRDLRRTDPARTAGDRAAVVFVGLTGRI